MTRAALCSSRPATRRVTRSGANAARGSSPRLHSSCRVGAGCKGWSLHSSCCHSGAAATCRAQRIGAGHTRTAAAAAAAAAAVSAAAAAAVSAAVAASFPPAATASVFPSPPCAGAAPPPPPPLAPPLLPTACTAAPAGSCSCSQLDMQRGHARTPRRAAPPADPAAADVADATTAAAGSGAVGSATAAITSGTVVWTRSAVSPSRSVSCGLHPAAATAAAAGAASADAAASAASPLLVSQLLPSSPLASPRLATAAPSPSCVPGAQVRSRRRHSEEWRARSSRSRRGTSGARSRAKPAAS